MLVIRAPQMQAFTDLMKNRFDVRMQTHLLIRFPARFSGPEDPKLPRLVRLGTAKAKSHGITGDTDIKRYLEFMTMLTPDFDVNPKSAWAGVILRDSRTTGHAKILALDSAHLNQKRKAARA